MPRYWSPVPRTSRTIQLLVLQTGINLDNETYTNGIQLYKPFWARLDARHLLSRSATSCSALVAAG